MRVVIRQGFYCIITKHLDMEEIPIYFFSAHTCTSVVLFYFLCIPYKWNVSCVSSLHDHLIEHLNAEIVLNTISDVSVALEWIKSTFLYIRVMKNPKHYG